MDGVGLPTEGCVGRIFLSGSASELPDSEDKRWRMG